MNYPQLPEDIGEDTSPEFLEEYRKNNELVGFLILILNIHNIRMRSLDHTLGESDVNRLDGGDGDFIHKVVEEKQTIAENFSEVETVLFLKL